MMKFSAGYKENIYHFIVIIVLTVSYVGLVSLLLWQPITTWVVITGFAAALVLHLIIQLNRRFLNAQIRFTTDWGEAEQFVGSASFDGEHGKLMLSDQRLQFKAYRWLRDPIRIDVPLGNIQYLDFRKNSRLSIAKNLLIINTYGGMVYLFQLKFWDLKKWRNVIGANDDIPIPSEIANPL